MKKHTHITVSYITAHPKDNDQMQSIIDALPICEKIGGDLKLQWTDKTITVSGTLECDYIVRKCCYIIYILNQDFETTTIERIIFQCKNISKL